MALGSECLGVETANVVERRVHRFQHANLRAFQANPGLPAELQNGDGSRQNSLPVAVPAAIPNHAVL